MSKTAATGMGGRRGGSQARGAKDFIIKQAQANPKKILGMSKPHMLKN